MFFSIIVPTYNPGDLLTRLLESLTCNNCVNDMEIILADDCSTEPYDDILENYSQLNIRIIKNESHQGFPRLGRSNGLKAATGKWITFLDQDDYFVAETFDKMKNYIHGMQATNFIVTDLAITDMGRLKKVDTPMNWTHGKFYEKAFLEKFDVKYPEVNYCEDIGLSVTLDIIKELYNISYYKYPEMFYIWNRSEHSLSEQDIYSYNSLPDYMLICMGLYLDAYGKLNEDERAQHLQFFQSASLIGLLHIFFSTQEYYASNAGINFDPAPDDINNYTPLMKEYYLRFKHLFNYNNNKHLMEHVYNLPDCKELYYHTRAEDLLHVQFVEMISFYDWITKIIDPDDE